VPGKRGVSSEAQSDANEQKAKDEKIGKEMCCTEPSATSVNGQEDFEGRRFCFETR
jgi:hypothetical protein